MTLICTVAFLCFLEVYMEIKSVVPLSGHRLEVGLDSLMPSGAGFNSKVGNIIRGIPWMD